MFQRFFLFMLMVITAIYLTGCVPPGPKTEKGKEGEVAKTVGENTPDAAGNGAQPGVKLVADPPDGKMIFEGEKHFKNMKQLTFEGENAEAYWSADGTRLTLQRHVGADKCDQIYIYDLKASEMKMVSTGDGVTTCSYFQYPKDDKIIYASTHLGGKMCPPKPDKSQGYVWKLYPDFDVFRANPDGSGLERLTDTPRYDAEGTYAPDGSRIIYTSLSTGDLELWTMNPDGSDKKQITNRHGYDGGAFYSWDSKKIVWRAYYPETPEDIAHFDDLMSKDMIEPMNLQIWTANADGSDAKQLTHNDAANFCPFYFIDNKRVIWASNFEGKYPHDFNLWMCNLDGTGLEKITTFDSFDGFPMFSPDGKKLAFGTNRNATTEGDTNIFVCDWVD